MERLAAIVLSSLLLLSSCEASSKRGFDAWSEDFHDLPGKFAGSATALWISKYTENPQSHRFLRTVGWGSVPEKLEPDGSGGYGVAIPLLLQSEDSDGPLPDQLATVLVRLLRLGSQWSMVSNDSLPGEVVGWNDEFHHTVKFRGRYSDGAGTRILWQFQGQY